MMGFDHSVWNLTQLILGHTFGFDETELKMFGEFAGEYFVLKHKLISNISFNFDLQIS